MSRVPAGDDFLSGFTQEQLSRMYHNEKQAKAKVRLLAAILRKEGLTLKEISKRISQPFTTVGDWLRRMHEEGIERCYSIKQEGRPSKLTEEQVKELQHIISRSPLEQGIPFAIWTTRVVRDFIGQKYGIFYKNRQTRNILCRMKMSPQKPRPSHRKANKKLQDAFKKTSGKIPGHLLKMDMRSCYWTKASSP